MRAAIALALAAAAAAGAQSGDGAYGMFSTSLEGATWSTLGRTSRSGAAELSMTWYAERIVDDGAPISLLPYLQRASTIHLSAAGAGFTTTDPGWPSGFDGNTLTATASVNRYLEHWLAMTASASIARSATTGPFPTTPSPSYVLPRASMGAALRWRDMRIDAGYRWAPTIRDGNYDARGWGRAFLGVESAVERALFLDLQTTTLPSGAEVQGSFNYYYTPRFQLGGSLAFSRGQIYFNETGIYSRIVPGGDLSWWFTPRLRALAAYGFFAVPGQREVRAQEGHHLLGRPDVRIAQVPSGIGRERNLDLGKADAAQVVPVRIGLRHQQREGLPCLWGLQDLYAVGPLGTE